MREAGARGVTFSICDRATWPEVLTADEIAAIYQRKVSGLKKSCQQRTFVPAPYRRHPYRWKKTDVIRDLDGVTHARFSRAS